MTGAFKIAPAETSLSKFEMRTEIWEYGNMGKPVKFYWKPAIA